MQHDAFLLYKSVFCEGRDVFVGRNEELRVRLINGVDEDVRINDIRPDVAEEFERALAEAGYDVQLLLIDGAAHSLGQPGFPQWEAILDSTIDVMSS